MVGHIAEMVRPQSGLMANSAGISMVSFTETMTRRLLGWMARNSGASTASDTGRMVQPRFIQTARRNGGGTANRSLKKSTLDCANGLRTPDLGIIMEMIMEHK